MSPRVDGTSPAPLYDYSNLSDIYTVKGETSLREVAEKLHVDPLALADANPQIKDGKVQALQVINLPQCSAQPPVQAESTDVHQKTAGPQLPSGPRGDTIAASAMKAILRATPMPSAAEDRTRITHELIDKMAKLAGGSAPYALGRLGSTLGSLPASEFKKQTDQIRKAIDSGDLQQAMYAVETADAASHAVSVRGGGQAIQAHASEKRDGFYFDFDLSLSKEQAASVIFQGGKVPEGATLEKGSGNTWVVKTSNDAESRQNVASHYNSHSETVGYRPSSDPAFGPERDLTFTWVVGGAHEPPPVSHRKDIDNDFGFKVVKHYALDPGQSPVQQVKAGLGTGRGSGYELVFDSPMTKDEVMGKLFEKGARFGKNDVQLTAVPKEPSSTWEVHIIGVDANTAIKRAYVPAFADAAINTKESARPDIPVGIQSWIDARKVPPNAIKHAPDVYTWEQDGNIAYVKTDGKNYYQGEVTKLSGDKASDKTIRYFVMEKGMPPEQGWKAFTEHWDDINRQMIAAFAFTLAAAGGMPGRDPEAAEGAIAATRRPRIGGKMEGELDSEATGATRGTAHAEPGEGTAGVKPTETGTTAKPNETGTTAKPSDAGTTEGAGAAGAKATTEPRTISETVVPNNAKPGKIDESDAKFSGPERRIAEKLKQEGSDVKAVPRSDTARSPDGIVNGKRTEFKSMEPEPGTTATSATVKNQISASVKRGGQARDMILDARGSGLTEAEARRGLARAVPRGKLDSVRIIGDGFDVTGKF